MITPFSPRVVSVAVLANGQPLDSRYQVQLVSVTKAVNTISSARIELLDDGAASGQPPLADAPVFLPGTHLTIQAGYDQQLTRLFEGPISKLSVASRGALGVGLVVECHDLASQTTASPKSRLFEDQKTSAILTQIIQAYPGLTAAIAPTAGLRDTLLQAHCTDWDFIVTQAEANGHLVLNELGTITTRAPTAATDEELLLEYGTNVDSFALELDARTQFTAVRARAWSPQEQALVEVTATLPSFETVGDLALATLAEASGQGVYTFETTTVADEAGLQQLADAYLLKLALAKVRGHLDLPGTAAVLPGDSVRLSRLGAHFNGRAFVSGVTHTLSADWKTRLTIGLAAPQVVPPPPGGGGDLRRPEPGVRGLYVAKVQQLESDPDGESRVRVFVPALQASVWARLVQVYATAGAGSYFYPELHDEVLLAYVGHGAADPVVLGALPSSARPPAYSPGERNSKKGIITVGGLQLDFDDAQQTLRLTTPAGDITLSPSGLTLDSQTSVHIRAAQDIHLEATKGDVTIQAGGDLRLAGVNAQVQASANLKLTSAAIGELSAGATLSVKSALVLIN
jgi:phage protein D